jgi:hypothetical protein
MYIKYNDNVFRQRTAKIDALENKNIYGETAD